jgi:hypothetical protein
LEEATRGHDNTSYLLGLRLRLLEWPLSVAVPPPFASGTLESVSMAVTNDMNESWHEVGVMLNDESPSLDEMTMRLFP